MLESTCGFPGVAERDYTVLARNALDTPVRAALSDECWNESERFKPIRTYDFAAIAACVR
ncbi:protein of unknown function (plasmid) [Caballeronia sp. S22]